MASGSVRLPTRFPVGTKFVIEGRPGGKGQVFGRYLEFPDGTRLRLPKRPTSPKSLPASLAESRRPRRDRTRRR